jgi:diguanylate cyclase (GGDEF)-like protein
MIRRMVKSIAITFQVAKVGFEKSFFFEESKDSILGYIDCLTKLPNRKAFERDKEFICKDYSLVMVDIDNLKIINDTRGHFIGDKIIQRLAAILTNEAGPNGRVYRYAGDEFVCLVPREDVEAFCSIVRNEAKQQDAFTISQGVILYLEQGMMTDALVMADVTMYRSKKRGKDQITIAPQFFVHENMKIPLFKNSTVRQQMA